MTGFGRYEAVTEERKITVEMKSVNHRYCDISIRLPKKLNFLEASIRNEIKKHINRGKIDVFTFQRNKKQIISNRGYERG